MDSHPPVFKVGVSAGRTYGSGIRSKICLCDQDPGQRPLGIRFALRFLYAMMLKQRKLPQQDPAALSAALSRAIQFRVDAWPRRAFAKL